MNKQDVLEWLHKSKIVPVIRANSADTALRLVEGLLEGGIDVLEITMTVPGAVQVMKDMARRFGDRALIGAGTVLDPSVAKACIDAGALFVVSPGLDRLTVEECNKAQVVCAPGALTPTEIVQAFTAGGDLIKVFPCDALGGASYLKSLKAPLPHIPLMPTGGVTLQSISSFFDAGAVAVGVGSNLVNPALSHEELVAKAKAFREAASVSLHR